MAILIVIVSIMMVYGTVMWVRPSARDRLLSSLRMDAIHSGIKVQQCLIEDLSIEGRINKLSRSVMFYRKLNNDSNRPTVSILRTTGESGIYLPEGWSWEHGKRLERPVLNQLTELITSQPDSVTGFELSPGYVGISWDERNLEQLNKISSDLDQMLIIDWNK